jgi:hypothetical protein
MSYGVPVDDYAPLVHAFRVRLPPDPVIAAPIMSVDVPVTRMLELLTVKFEVLLT